MKRQHINWLSYTAVGLAGVSVLLCYLITAGWLILDAWVAIGVAMVAVVLACAGVLLVHRQQNKDLALVRQMFAQKWGHVPPDDWPSAGKHVRHD